ncbi:aspartate-semialdehyde dehydrogenase, partial [bacterium]|nr:aspartate-semialdehyde dehydrogenase [bacterium]
CELKEKATPDEIRELLSTAPGVKVIDDVAGNHFPMPIESTEEYDVRVGRIRTDYLFDNGIAMLISGDQLLKGAAFNAVQIAELLLNL